MSNLNGSPNLEIRDFVADTLIQIAEGVAAARTAVEQAGGALNVYTRGQNLDQRARKVHFDLAVQAAVTRNIGGEGEAKARLGVVTIGGSLGANSESARERIHRIQFDIDIVLDGSRDTEREDRAERSRRYAEEHNRRMAGEHSRMR